MSNELALQIPESLRDDMAKSEADAKLLGTAGFLPYIKLMTSNSNEVKDGVVQDLNSFYLVQGDKLTSLGKSVDVLVCGVRPKAAKLDGGKMIAVYDVNSEMFKKMQAAEASAPKGTLSGYLIGNEFLFYVPGEQVFATMHCSGKTGRRSSGEIQALLAKSATLTPKKIATNDYTWWTFSAAPCQVPFEYDTPACLEHLAKFLDEAKNAPIPVEPEQADVGAGRAR